MSFTVLSTHDYHKWTKRWKDDVEYSKGPLPYFLHDGQVQTGVIFHFKSLRYLFSTPGVVVIKIRFGLHDPGDGGTPRFHLILFGVDSRDRTITPYFTSSAFTHHHHYPKVIEGEGNLPQALMHMWKKNWHEQAAAAKVSVEMFWLYREDGGFLKGYSYSLKEVMDAVGTFPGISNIHIKFGLHEYYSLDENPETDPVFVNTFGLILYAGVGVPLETGNTSPAGHSEPAPVADDTLTTEGPLTGSAHEEIDESGYYDFTAPCPYTC